MHDNFPSMVERFVKTPTLTRIPLERRREKQKQVNQMWKKGPGEAAFFRDLDLDDLSQRSKYPRLRPLKVLSAVQYFRQVTSLTKCPESCLEPHTMC